MTRWLLTLLRAALPPLVVLLLVLATWHTIQRTWQIRAYLLPHPWAVAQVAWQKRAELASATWVTGLAALAGFVLSLGVGSAVALLFSQSALVRRSLFPYAIFLQTVPIVAIAPLVIIWFGTGLQSVILVSLVISLFPIITNVTAGLLQVEPALVELFAVHNASRWQELWKLRVPNAVPHLVTGAKVSCGLSVIGAIVGEFFAGYGADSYGLGYLINQTKDSLQTAYLFAAVGASTLLGVGVFATVSLAAATVLSRWHVDSRAPAAVNGSARG